jgi:hypothetical protein
VSLNPPKIWRAAGTDSPRNLLRFLFSFKNCEQNFGESVHVIEQKLKQLDCPVSLFVPIAGLVGRTRLTQFLSGTAQLDRNLIEKLIGVLDELIELKSASIIAPDWSDAENIREQLRRRREIKLAIEYDETVIRELLQGK